MYDWAAYLETQVPRILCLCIWASEILKTAQYIHDINSYVALYYILACKFGANIFIKQCLFPVWLLYLEISHKGFFILDNVLHTCTQLQNLHGSILLDVSFAEILCVDNLLVFKFSSIGKRKNIKGLFFVVVIIRFSV